MESNGAGMRWEGGGAPNDGTNIYEWSQGVSRDGRATDKAAGLGREPWQGTLTEDSREDVSSHGLWKQGTTTIFDIQNFNLDSGFYLCMTIKKEPENLEKEKKDK